MTSLVDPRQGKQRVQHNNMRLPTRRVNSKHCRGKDDDFEYQLHDVYVVYVCVLTLEELLRESRNLNFHGSSPNVVLDPGQLIARSPPRILFSRE